MFTMIILTNYHVFFYYDIHGKLQTNELHNIHMVAATSARSGRGVEPQSIHSRIYISISFDLMQKNRGPKSSTLNDYRVKFSANNNDMPYDVISMVVPSGRAAVFTSHAKIATAFIRQYP